MKTPKFYTEFEHQDPVIDFAGSESLTRQEFATECDINTIIKKYQATGFLVDPSVARSRQPMFGDFTSAPDFERSQQIVACAQENFEKLPVELRQRFNYDPVELLRFLDNPANRDEAVKLGLIDAPAKPVSSAKQPSVAVTPQAEPALSASNGMTPEQSALSTT